jgi:hypothetical protein
VNSWFLLDYFKKESHLIPIEIKSSKTFSSSFLDGLKYFHEQSPQRAEGGALIYAGTQMQKIGPFQLCTAEQCAQLLLISLESVCKSKNNRLLN